MVGEAGKVTEVCDIGATLRQQRQCHRKAAIGVCKPLSGQLPFLSRVKVLLGMSPSILGVIVNLGRFCAIFTKTDRQTSSACQGVTTA